jgi:hypothetical protein
VYHYHLDRKISDTIEDNVPEKQAIQKAKTCHLTYLQHRQKRRPRRAKSIKSINMPDDIEISIW